MIDFINSLEEQIDHKAKNMIQIKLDFKDDTNFIIIPTNY